MSDDLIFTGPVVTATVVPWPIRMVFPPGEILHVTPDARVELPPGVSLAEAKKRALEWDDRTWRPVALALLRLYEIEAR